MVVVELVRSFKNLGRLCTIMRAIGIEAAFYECMELHWSVSKIIFETKSRETSVDGRLDMLDHVVNTRNS